MPPHIHDKSEHEKEANLNDFRLSKGLTIREVCSESGVSMDCYVALNNGTKSPVVERGPNRGQLKETAKRLVEFFNADLEDLFPRYYCRIAENGLVPEQYDMFCSRLEQIDDVERRHDVRKALNVLTTRERMVIRYRFAESETYRDIGRKIGVNAQRVSQIETKALQKLRRFYRKTRGYVCNARSAVAIPT